MRVNAYVLGSGPSALTVMVDSPLYEDDRSWDLTRDEANETPQEFAERLRQYHERRFSEGGGSITGREAMLFIGPSVDTMAEVWEVMETWYLERQNGGNVVAVRPDRDEWIKRADYQQHRARIEMSLAAFSTAVTTAHQTRVAANGGRTNSNTSYPKLVTDANELSAYFREVGAYDHPDGPPAKPPPPHDSSAG